jgi:hypothetical protein
VHQRRVLPRRQPDSEGERAVPLSLLDATTANFGLTSAIWLLERPSVSLPSDGLAQNLETALAKTLEAYPQWSGYLKAVLDIDTENLPLETASFPAHAKRYGRVYAHFGTQTDPGVAFVEATSAATVNELYSAASAKRRPVWNRREDKATLTQFVPRTSIAHALEPDERDADDGLFKPIMAVQCTQLACGGLVLAVKIAHPLADITSLARFVRDWADVSRAMLAEAPLPLLEPIFDPSLLDTCAAGDINANAANPTIMEDAFALPLHRYDWWASPGKPPSVFSPDLLPAGKPMPWSEWDTKAPVEQSTIHFTREQIDHLWKSATRDTNASPPGLEVSKHDALLAHIWSCIARARGLQDDQDSIHCDLVLGTRPAFHLDNSFAGSPTMMLDIATTASAVASGQALGAIARRIRETLSTANTPQRLAAHLHSIAFEASPQRIWQAFLGRRHILVTTWARAGLYGVDFGFGSRIRYADGVVPCLDGCVLIMDSAPPGPEPLRRSTGKWTENGVDVTVPLRAENMCRLLGDPLLLP